MSTFESTTSPGFRVEETKGPNNEFYNQRAQSVLCKASQGNQPVVCNRFHILQKRSRNSEHDAKDCTQVAGVLCALDSLISLHPVYKYWSICCNYSLIATILSLMGNDCAQIINISKKICMSV